MFMTLLKIILDKSKAFVFVKDIFSGNILVMIKLHCILLLYIFCCIFCIGLCSQVTRKDFQTLYVSLFFRVKCYQKWEPGST